MNFDILPFLERYFEPDEKIILACSTWADSMFLLYKILETPYKNNLVACYFNHGTRPECAIEENFLLTLWESEGFQVEIGECDFEKSKNSIQVRVLKNLLEKKDISFLMLFAIYMEQIKCLLHIIWMIELKHFSFICSEEANFQDLSICKKLLEEFLGLCYHLKKPIY